MTSADGATDTTRDFTTGERDRAPRWSPDGARLAFVRAEDKHRPQIHLIDLDGGEARAVTDLEEGSIGTLRWSPDGRHIAFSFRAVDPQWTQAAIKERKENGLTDPPREIDDWWYRLDGDGYFNAQRYQLWIVDTETGSTRCLYKKDRLGGFTFDFSPRGDRLAVTTNRAARALVEPWKDEIAIIDVARGTAKPLTKLPAGPKTNVKWSPDGKQLAWAGREGRDGTYSVENLELWVANVDGTAAKSLTANTDDCLMAIAVGDTSGASFEPNLAWSPNSTRLYMRIGRHGESHVASVPRRGGALTMHTSGTAEWDLGSFSADGSRVALQRSAPVALPEVWSGVVGKATAPFTTTAATALNAALLRELTLARPKSHWVKTADGTKVHTWVLLPPGHTKSSRKRYPAILEIHGGPHGQYGVGFFHEMQLLAAHGYVVVFSNPRGSKGYGRDHCAAIRGAWGTADWVDIQAVTAFMQEHAHIDPKRMGIMGGSYGGYMTNWAIGHTHDFKAAITDRCVSNLVSMGGNSDYIEAPDEYFAGNFWDRPEARWESSPIRTIGNCRTPTLIIHSEGDLRCNVEQGEQVFAALKLLGVPTRFVRYPASTSHGMSRSGPPDMRLHRLREILAWWAARL